MKKKQRSFMVKLLISWSKTLLIAYLGLCLLLRLIETRLIFFPSSEIRATPSDLNLTYKTVSLPVSTGKIQGWWINAAKPDAKVLIYLHGNSSNLGDLVNRFLLFHQQGLAVFAIDYRGYGASDGPFPDEKKVYEDAEIAWNYVTNHLQILPQNIVIYGQSLGGAIAIQLAVSHPNTAGLIVESTFTSIRAMIDYYVPIRLIIFDWIITQKFDSLSKIKTLKTPILILHGNRDRTVPVHMSSQLFSQSPEPKQLLLISQANHDNIPWVAKNLYLKTLEHFIKFVAKP